MRLRDLRLTMATLLAALLACPACASRIAMESSVRAGLPGLAGLDELSKDVSSQRQVDVTAPLLEANSSPIGPQLALVPPGEDLAFAVFRIATHGFAAQSIAAAGTDGFHLFLADFESQRWVLANRFAGGVALGSLGNLGQALSDAGFVYCAVVAPPGVQGQLSSLLLNYDGPANVFFVAPPESGGSDNNPGSSELPWATLQHAADNSVPDSLILVRAGNYQGFELSQGGTANAPIIFRAEEGVELTPGQFQDVGIGLSESAGEIAFVTIEGFTISNFFGVSIELVADVGQARRITLRGNTCSGSSVAGIYVSQIRELLIEENDISAGFSGSGIQIRGDCDLSTVRNNTIIDTGVTFIALSVSLGETPDTVLVEGNVCASLTSGGSPGLGTFGATDLTVRNNLFLGQGNGAIIYSDLETVSSDILLANNTFVRKAGGSEAAVLLTASPQVRLYNNIILGQEEDTYSLSLDTTSLSGFESDYNVLYDRIALDGGTLTLAEWQAAHEHDLHSQLSSPAALFVDAANADPALRDFHLLPGCPAVGLALADFLPPFDLDGVSRPQGGAGDCGCYEFVP